MGESRGEGKYLSLGITFIFLVLGIVILSLVWRLVVTWQQNKFDGQHGFIIQTVQGNNATYLSLDPQANTIVVITVHNTNDDDRVPIPENITVSNKLITTDKVGSFLANSLSDASLSKLTIFDKIQLWWLARSVKPDQIKALTIHMPLTDEQVVEMAILLNDKAIYQEGKTIAVINASGIPGLGTRIGKMLNVIGGNVISVGSSDTLQARTTIQTTGESYTLTRLEEIFGVHATIAQGKPSIADITIRVGKDREHF